MIRPKKYHTEAQRRAAIHATKKKFKRISGRYFRLVVPALAGYPPGWTWQMPQIAKLRERVVDMLVARERKRGLDQYLVAVQRHAGSGEPHLDILMVYSKPVKNSLTRYDYIIKHGNLTKYRTVNAAILDYGRKQDPHPLGNLDTSRVVMQSRVKSELYTMMQQAMLKQPFQFDVHAWLHSNDLNRAAVKTNVYKAIRMLRDKQAAKCNRLLELRPGILQITPELIQRRLTAAELHVYRSWPGYQIIVDHINQIPRWGCHRPHKTRNLLVVGRPDTGKTRLALQIQLHTAVYYKDVSNWFPSYRSGVYRMVLWNEFSLRGLAYPKLLNYLEGAKMDLQYKGGSVLKTDNQLVYMTSNMSLQRHICGRFKSAENRELSRRNLRARVTEVVIPEGYDLFLLLKLIVKKTKKSNTV